MITPSSLPPPTQYHRGYRVWGTLYFENFSPAEGQHYTVQLTPYTQIYILRGHSVVHPHTLTHSLCVCVYLLRVIGDEAATPTSSQDRVYVYITQTYASRVLPLFYTRIYIHNTQRNEEMWRNANDSLEGVKNTRGQSFRKGNKTLLDSYNKRQKAPHPPLRPPAQQPSLRAVYDLCCSAPDPL